MKNLPVRKPTRLQNYDYSRNGCYFVTVCVKNRKPILSTIVGGGDLDAPKTIVLKPYGRIAEKYIQSMESAYDTIRVENYIIMPNHIHLLISINACGAPRSSPPTVSSILAAWKRFVNQEIGMRIWQRGFYDRIIRNQAEFENAWNYIEYNALKEYAEKAEKDCNQ